MVEAVLAVVSSIKYLCTCAVVLIFVAMDKWLIRNKETSNDTNDDCPASSNERQQNHSQEIQLERPISPLAPRASKRCKYMRRYQAEYIKFGFSVFVEEGCDERPQCVICYKVLSNQSMKPSLLIRHITTKHPSFENKPKEFFFAKRK